MPSSPELDCCPECGVALVRMRAQIRELEDALYECAAISGADVSGRPKHWSGWRSRAGEWAIQEVKELRAGYDEACLSP